MMKKKSEICFTKKRENQDNEVRGHYKKIVQAPAET